MRQQAIIAALSLSLAGIAVLGGRAQTPAAANLTAFHLLEATIDDVQAAFQAKRLTCRALVELYLRRIDAYDKAGPSLNAVQTVNPHALREADRRNEILEQDRRHAHDVRVLWPLRKTQVDQRAARRPSAASSV